jgi:LmbE family N-acetylglucosaminyl deacetylase
MLFTTGGLLGASLFGYPVPVKGARGDQAHLKILVSGGHPDDPESGCGGSICRFTASGHEVVTLYLTRGEAGIEGKTHQEAAEIRTTEALEACKVMGARPVFAGQVDGDTQVNKDAYARIASIIRDERPDLVFTHWPIDTHPDHRVTSHLVYHVWNWFRLDESLAFDLYYYEVLTGEQSQNFHPSHFIDITKTAILKREATMKHVSQKPEEWYAHHEKMDEFRGFQSGWGVKYAEAFARQGFTGIV